MKDAFDLYLQFKALRISVLKNKELVLVALLWFVAFPYYLGDLVKLLPHEFLQLVEKLYRGEHPIIPFALLLPLSWIILFVLFRELFCEFRKLLKEGGFYKFTKDSWHKDWLYNGKVRLLENPLRLRVNSSRAGCLLKKRLWRNFKMAFKMRWLEGLSKYIGLVFKAVDLDNYFMLEIIEEEGRIYAKPHTRYLGMWEIMSVDQVGEVGDNQDLSVNLEVKENKVSLEIDHVGSYEWVLPTHVDINHIEDGVKKGKTATDAEASSKTPILPEVEFKDIAGMIGFRAHLDQGAEIESLTVKNL